MPSIRSTITASAFILSLISGSDARVAKVAANKVYTPAQASQAVAELPQWMKEALVKSNVLSGDMLSKRQQPGATCFNDTIFMGLIEQPAITPYCSSLLMLPVATSVSTVSSGTVTKRVVTSSAVGTITITQAAEPTFTVLRKRQDDSSDTTTYADPMAVLSAVSSVCSCLPLSLSTAVTTTTVAAATTTLSGTYYYDATIYTVISVTSSGSVPTGPLMMNMSSTISKPMAEMSSAYATTMDSGATSVSTGSSYSFTSMSSSNVTISNSTSSSSSGDDLPGYEGYEGEGEDVPTSTSSSTTTPNMTSLPAGTVMMPDLSCPLHNGTTFSSIENGVVYTEVLLCDTTIIGDNTLLTVASDAATCNAMCLDSNYGFTESVCNGDSFDDSNGDCLLTTDSEYKTAPAMGVTTFWVLAKALGSNATSSNSMNTTSSDSAAAMSSAMTATPTVTTPPPGATNQAGLENYAFLYYSSMTTQYASRTTIYQSTETQYIVIVTTNTTEVIDNSGSGETVVYTNSTSTSPPMPLITTSSSSSSFSFFPNVTSTSSSIEITSTSSTSYSMNITSTSSGLPTSVTISPTNGTIFNFTSTSFSLPPFPIANATTSSSFMGTGTGMTSSTSMSISSSSSSSMSFPNATFCIPTTVTFFPNLTMSSSSMTTSTPEPVTYTQTYTETYLQVATFTATATETFTATETYTTTFVSSAAGASTTAGPGVQQLRGFRWW